MNVDIVAEFTISDMCSTGDSGLSVCLGKILELNLPGTDTWAQCVWVRYGGSSHLAQIPLLSVPGLDTGAQCAWAIMFDVGGPLREQSQYWVSSCLEFSIVVQSRTCF